MGQDVGVAKGQVVDGEGPVLLAAAGVVVVHEGDGAGCDWGAHTSARCHKTVDEVQQGVRE